MTGIHIDSFSAMENLTKKQQSDTATVLRALHKAGRFSCFDASENPVIAGTITRICHSKPPLIEPDNETPYPWTKAKLTPAGLAFAGLPPNGVSGGSAG